MRRLPTFASRSKCREALLMRRDCGEQLERCQDSTTRSTSCGQSSGQYWCNCRPRLEFSVKTTRTFFEAVPPKRGTIITCEPRHASWFSAAADAVLRELNVTRVAADPARCAGAGEAGGARRFAYFRWHGTPCLYYSKYSDAQLHTFATKVRRSKAREIWCIFDNTARHAAREEVPSVRSLISQESELEPRNSQRRLLDRA